VECVNFDRLIMVYLQAKHKTLHDGPFMRITCSIGNGLLDKRLNVWKSKTGTWMGARSYCWDGHGWWNIYLIQTEDLKQWKQLAD